MQNKSMKLIGVLCITMSIVACSTSHRQMDAAIEANVPWEQDPESVTLQAISMAKAVIQRCDNFSRTHINAIDKDVSDMMGEFNDMYDGYASSSRRKYHLEFIERAIVTYAGNLTRADCDRHLMLIEVSLRQAKHEDPQRQRHTTLFSVK